MEGDRRKEKGNKGSKGSKGNEQREMGQQGECTMYIQSVFVHIMNVWTMNDTSCIIITIGMNFVANLNSV